MCLKRYFTCILVFLGAMALSAQDSTQIVVRSRVQKTAVLLRWAAATPMAWKQTNKYGFYIERYTVVRNGQRLPQAEKKIIGSGVMKARPLKEWEALVKNDKYAAVIAQALYGKDFELTGNDAKGIARIIHLSEALEQRFALSLYAADQSFEAACKAGWGYRDTDLKPGERYLYRIIPALPGKSGLKMAMGVAYVSLDEYEELPEPAGLSAIFGDKSVMLTWDYGQLKDVYNTYYIEKSTDGKQFARLNATPLANLNNRSEQMAQRMYYIDTLSDNHKQFYYRVVGTTAFGETGPPSAPAAGQGKQQLPYSPSITRSVINDKGELELDWSFDQRGEGLIRSFSLNRSAVPDKNFQPVLENIAPAERSVVYDRLDAVNYFTIAAVPAEGAPAVSFPVLVQPVDSLPPSVPQGLTATIDTMGVVKIEWRSNAESDLLGYKVYRAHVAGEELVPLFYKALRDTVYYDTVSVKNLNPFIYYSVSAVDGRYNHSDLAPVLVVEKPDLIPPSSPVISGYQIKDEGIEIRWINSPDKGVVQHRIYRYLKSMAGKQESIQLICIDSLNIQAYIDTTVEPGIYYSYVIAAVKKSGKISKFSNVFTGVTYKSRQPLEILSFDAILDKSNRLLKLQWTDKLKDVFCYELYKNKDDQHSSLWKTIEGAQYEIMDEKMQIGATYHYMIRAIMKNGRKSKVKELTINY